MTLLARSEMATLAKNGVPGAIIAEIRGATVVYVVAAKVDGELQYVHTPKGTKAYKSPDTAVKAMADHGFADVEIILPPDAKSMLLRAISTLKKIETAFAKRGSLTEFASEQGFYYTDVVGVIQHGKRQRDIQIAIAKHLDVDPRALWPDFEAIT